MLSSWKMYEVGLGVTIDLAKALEYYSAVAQKGSKKAKKILEGLSSP